MVRRHCLLPAYRRPALGVAVGRQAGAAFPAPRPLGVVIAALRRHGLARMAPRQPSPAAPAATRHLMIAVAQPLFLMMQVARLLCFLEAAVLHRLGRAATLRHRSRAALAQRLHSQAAALRRHSRVALVLRRPTRAAAVRCHCFLARLPRLGLAAARRLPSGRSLALRLLRLWPG